MNLHLMSSATSIYIYKILHQSFSKLQPEAWGFVSLHYLTFMLILFQIFTFHVHPEWNIFLILNSILLDSCFWSILFLAFRQTRVEREERYVRILKWNKITATYIICFLIQLNTFLPIHQIHLPGLILDTYCMW